MFGEQLFKSKGKYLTIVEGEFDALAAYEMLGSKWPVLSVRSGAQGAERDVKASLEYLESFDTVIINFDEDKVGRESARRVARLLKPSKAKIMSLPEGFKDANDMLHKHDHRGYVAAWWASKTGFSHQPVPLRVAYIPPGSADTAAARGCQVGQGRCRPHRKD